MNSLLETGLSFRGVEAHLQIACPGSLVSDGRADAFPTWWIVLFPSLVIFFTTLAIGIIGDAVRDRLNSTLR